MLFSVYSLLNLFPFCLIEIVNIGFSKERIIDKKYRIYRLKINLERQLMHYNSVHHKNRRHVCRYSWGREKLQQWPLKPSFIITGYAHRDRSNQIILRYTIVRIQKLRNTTKQERESKPNDIILNEREKKIDIYNVYIYIQTYIHVNHKAE